MERKKIVTYQSCDFCDNADEAKGECDICDKCFCEDHGQNYPWGDQLYEFCSEHYPIVDDIVKKTGIPVGFVVPILRGDGLSEYKQDLWDERGYESKWKATFADLVRSEAEEKSRKAYMEIARLETDARIAKGWQEVDKRGIRVKKEQIEVNLYKDERDNWRYNCDKLKVSGGFCPRELAEELDKKYGSKTDTTLPVWLVAQLKTMKNKRLAISPTADDFISGWNAAIREIEAASRGYVFPRAITRLVGTEEKKEQTIHITSPESESEQESEIYNGGIYKTLKPNDCYIITVTGDRLLVASNKDGKIELEYISLATEDDAMAAIYAIGAGRAIGAGINTLLKMLSEQESAITKEEKTEIGSESSTGTPEPNFNIVSIKVKEPDIVSNPLTGETVSHGDNTSVPQPKVDTASIRRIHKNF